MDILVFINVLDMCVDIIRIAIHDCYNYSILMLFFITKLNCYRLRKLVTRNLI